MGGGQGRFPTTHHSVIGVLRTGDPAKKNVAWDSLIQMYWKPVYKYLRIKWNQSNEDAKDLTQGFFATAIEKQYFQSYDPAKSRFRTFLRTCLDGYVANQQKAARAMKRGGDALFVPLDFHQAEIELKQHPASADDVFEKEWIRSLFSTALEAFRRNCEEQNKIVHFKIFEKYDIDRDASVKISYADLAEEFGIAVTAVTNHLAYARREFRKTVLLKLEEISGNEEEYRSDARRLFGVTFE